jgi:hypothetical protein
MILLLFLIEMAIFSGHFPVGKVLWNCCVQMSQNDNDEENVYIYYLHQWAQ